MGIYAFGKLLGTDPDISDALNEMRRRVMNEPDAVILSIPRIMRFSLSNDEILEIINSVVLKRAEASP